MEPDDGFDFRIGSVAQVEDVSRWSQAADEVLQKKAARLDAVPGVGAITAACVLEKMPEPGTLSSTAAAALAGLAPYNRDSGDQSSDRDLRRQRRVQAMHRFARVRVHRTNSGPILTQFLHSPDVSKMNKDVPWRDRLAGSLM